MPVCRDDAIAKPAAPGARPTIALALGGGGARGLAHILVLEAFDELGIKPDRIVGTSIGAIYGAAYASGLSARLIRAHTEETLGKRLDLARQLLSSRAAPAFRLLSFLPVRPALLDATALLEFILPSRVKRDFSQLSIPLAVVATDFYAQEQAVFASGALRPAVAASMALPAIFSPVAIDGRAMVDGGLVNPLPFDLIAGTADVTVAIDVSGGPKGGDANRQPSAFEVLMASSQIFQRSIVREKLKAGRPDIYIDCAVDDFTVLDFHRFRDVLISAEATKDQLKRQLARALESRTSDGLAAADPPVVAAFLPRPGPAKKPPRPAGRLTRKPS